VQSLAVEMVLANPRPTAQPRRRGAVLPAHEPPLRACLDHAHLKQGFRGVNRHPAL